MNLFFFFTDSATTEIYTLSLHDALPFYYVLVGRAQTTGALPFLQLQSDRKSHV